MCDGAKILSVPVMSGRVIGIQCNRPLESLFCIDPIPSRICEECQGCVSFAQPIIQRKGLSGRGLTLGITILRKSVVRLQYVGIRQTRVGERKTRLELDRLLKIINGPGKAFLVPLVPEVTAAQIQLISFRVVGEVLLEGALFVGGESRT